MIKKIYDANKTDFVEHHEKPDGINILDYKSSESAGVRSDIRSIIHLINLHGEDLVGIELGVYRALSHCTILQNCPNVKTLYGIDFWKSYEDFLDYHYDGSGSHSHGFLYSKRDAELNKVLAQHHIKYSGCEERSIIYDKDSNEAVKDFEDEFFDFIFLDSYTNIDEAVNDLSLWYPKLKTKGIFAGHDWACPAIEISVNNFRQTNNIKTRMSVFDDTFVWIKN